MPRLQSVLLSDFDILIQLPYTAVHADLFLSYFSLPAIIQTNSCLSWEVIQKYEHG